MNQPQEQDLGQLLLQQGLLTSEQLDQFHAEKRQHYRQAQEALQGILYQIDEILSVLYIRESLSYSLLAEISLGPASVVDWTPWGEHLLLFDPITHEYQHHWPQELFCQPADTFGLVSSIHFDYVYSPSISQQSYLPLCQALYSNRCYLEKESHGPFDLQLIDQGQLLLIGDRSSGQIQVVSTEHHHTQHTLKIRAPGFQKSMHTTWLPEQNKLLITDGLTGVLKTYHLKTHQWEEHDLGLGVLANMGPTPESNLFYVYAIQPTPAIHICHVNTFQSVAHVLLEGTSASPYQNIPTELVVLAPDKEHLLVLTYQHSATCPFIPCINVLHLPTVQLLQHRLLLPQLRPSGLAYIQANPANQPQQNLLPWLLQKKWLTSEQVSSISATGPLPRITSQADASVSWPQPLHPPQRMVELQPGARAEVMPFPAEALSEVVAYLKEEFWRHYEHVLTQYPLIEQELNTEAHRILDMLTTHQEVTLYIPAFFHRQDLKTTISRTQLTQFLTLQKAQPLPIEDVVPTHCPLCQQPLLGRWICNSCGFELDNPQSQQQRRHVSMTPITHMGPGYVLLADAHHQRLVVLNPFKYIVWELSTAAIGLSQPVWAVWLPNRQILVTDATGQIAKLNFSGQIVWLFNTHLSPVHRLNQPTKATMYLHPDGSERILIVDQGHHRVLEVNHQSEILWQYGHQDQAGLHPGYLSAPSDIQRTCTGSYLIADTGNHRVLEISDNYLLNEYGRQEQLKSPVFAECDLKGNLFIVDAGNFRLLELKTKQAPHLQCTYFRTGMEVRYKLVPHGAIRLANRNILLWDHQSLQEIAPQQKVRTWHMLWPELQWVPGLQKTAFIPANEATKPGPLHLDLQERLATLPLFRSAPLALLRQLVAALEPLYLEPQACLIEAGRQQDCLYLLCKGQLQLCQTDHPEQPVTQLPTEAILGGMSILVPETRSYSIQAVTACEIMVLKPDILQQYLHDFPDFAAQIHDLTESRKQLVALKQEPVISIQPTALFATVLHHQLSQSSHPPTVPPPLQLTSSHLGSLLPLKIWCLDRKRNVLCCLNRQGEIIWEYEMESPYRALKPQSLYEQNGHLFIVDATQHRIVQIASFDQQIIHEWKAPDIELLRPRSVFLTAQGLLIADEGHQRLLEISLRGTTLWEFGHPHAIDQPYYAECVSDDHILYVDAGLNIVKEINREGHTIWEFGTQGELNRPEFATRLPTGHTLIADTLHHRIIEVTSTGNICWEYKGNLNARLVNPIYCQRLSNCHTLVTHQQQHQTQEIDLQGRVVWDLRLRISGMLNLTGITMGSAVADTLPYTDLEKHTIHAALAEGEHCFELHLKLRKNCKMKATRLAMVGLLLDKLGTLIKTYPPPEDIMADKTGQKVNFTLLTRCSDAHIFEEVLGVAEVEQVDLYRLVP